MMSVFEREIPLGKVRRNTKNYKLSVIIRYSQESWGECVSMFSRCNGHVREFFPYAQHLINGTLLEPSIQVADMATLYLIYMAFASRRARTFSSEQNTYLAVKEIGDKCQIIDHDLQHVLRSAGMSDRTYDGKVPEMSEDAMKWLFSLPGFGATFDQVMCNRIPAEDYFAIISTTG